MSYKDRIKQDHKLKPTTREITRHLCDEPTCEFYGKEANQGICFTILPDYQSQYCEYILQSGQHLLEEMKRLRKAHGLESQEEWVQYLEGHIVCDWANHDNAVDCMIYLRAENAKLRAKLEKYEAVAQRESQ